MSGMLWKAHGSGHDEEESVSAFAFGAPRTNCIGGVFNGFRRKMGQDQAHAKMLQVQTGAHDVVSYKNIECHKAH